MNTATIDQRDDEARSGRGLPVAWPALLVAAWLLYECTAQPALAALVVCLKFGWTDLRTALWLRRVDPDRCRGIACFWWYLTFGLWKVALMGTMTVVLLGFIGALIDNGRPPANNRPASPVLDGALVAALIGFGLSFLSSYVALWKALRHGVRIWLGIAPHRTRAGRFWPPSEGRTNFAPYVTFTTLVLTVWAAALLALAAILAWQPRGGLEAFLILTGMLVLIAGMIMIFPVLARSVSARTPRDCWNAGPGEAAYQDAGSPDASL